MSADIEKAKSFLFEFLSAMKAWNNKFATLFQHGGSLAHRDQAEAEVRPIYERYLATINQERPIFSVGYPGEYDPEAEKIVSTESPNARKVVIETLWTHPGDPPSTQQHRYTMINKSGEWRLDKDEFYDSVENKWVKRAFFVMKRSLGMTTEEREAAQRGTLVSDWLARGHNHC